MPVLRRLGFRTQTEIDYERYALKALRGDFQGVSLEEQHGKRGDVSHILKAIER